MNLVTPLNKRCHFRTDKLLVESYQIDPTDDEAERVFANCIMKLMTPAVTQSLPENWQKITTEKEAIDWWQQRLKESCALTVKLLPGNEIIGFVFLHEVECHEQLANLHIGYLIGEDYWSKGYGSDLIKGVVNWALLDKRIYSIIGGVDSDNKGSIKVLEKNGFRLSNQKGPSQNTLFFEYVFERKISDDDLGGK
ncbi:GNAT family N-acetyltransferase [Aliikangiella coralliicola]|uniref:GNAT family N-acetyltransferase n=1 Tax=Aliikangiella coralliicola TaxID=2592383 RepID=A0A545UE42_9GAMM|nr:GNAT family N-acetyltransferase [Aliikangiella coralliicola]TQV87742.1 GNAT family N-acetyltransferase [Aliikangiella coralliicola]